MPRSHSRERSTYRSRSRSASPERSVPLPGDASPISESDYFLKNDEFRFFDELSSERARKYFRKFVKAWNRGKLPKSLYVGVDSQSASSNTAYRWSFASKASKADTDNLRSAREEIASATYNRPSASTSRASGSARVLGPTLPSSSDMTLARETAEEARVAERAYERKRERREAKERLEEVVGPKPLGREGMLEKKRAQRETNREFREKGDEGLEVDESTLLGGGDSFRAALAKRDAAKKRYEEKKFGGREERMIATRERADAIKEKDKATMDMFMQMAKDRFG